MLYNERWTISQPCGNVTWWRRSGGAPSPDNMSAYLDLYIELHPGSLFVWFLNNKLPKVHSQNMVNCYEHSKES